MARAGRERESMRPILLPLANYAVADIAAVKSWLESQGAKVSDIQQEGDSPRHAWF